MIALLLAITIGTSCDFGDIDSGVLRDLRQHTKNAMSAEQLAAPLTWDASNDLWQGYDAAQPFDQPDDTRIRWFARLFTADGSERWLLIMVSKATPDTAYVYAFDNTTAYVDAGGDHYGQHPCRVFSLDIETINLWIGE